jgi:putative endonuclease
MPTPSWFDTLTMRVTGCSVPGLGQRGFAPPPVHQEAAESRSDLVAARAPALALMVSVSNHEGYGTMPRPHCEPPMELFVYIVRCRDGSYNVGSTKKHPLGRVWEHNQRLVKGYTHSRTPVELVYAEHYERIVEGLARERQIKGWSRA